MTDTPRYLNQSEAAQYVGVSETTFKNEVASGIWPQPMRRGSKDTRRTWDRRLLDLWADRHSGIGSTQESAPMVNAEELIALERIDANKNRPANRRQKAA